MPSWFWWCVLSGRYLLLIDLWNWVGLPGVSDFLALVSWTRNG